MFDMLLSVMVFALAVSLKGGLLGNIFTNWNRLTERLEDEFLVAIDTIKHTWRSKMWGDLLKELALFPFHAFVKWFVDGSVISLFVVFFYVWATATLPVAVVFALAWVLIWSSMGEEAGAAGDYVEWWGDYKDAGLFNRSYGIKKGIQYGCFTGAGMSMAVGSWCIWIAAATFPLCYYLGNSLLRYTSGGKKRGWPYSEPLWGAVIGVGYGLALKGVLPISSVFTF